MESHGLRAGNGAGSPHATTLNGHFTDRDRAPNDLVENVCRTLQEAELEASISPMTTTIYGGELENEEM